MPQLLAIGLPIIPASNYRAWTEDEVTDGQIKTLLLLAENNSENFTLILNKFYYFLSDKLLRKLIMKVAQTANGPAALQTLMSSHAVKSLFYEKVSNSGLQRIKGSFGAFFTEFLAGAASVSKQCGEALFKSLQSDPYQLAFGLFLLRRPPNVIS